MNNTQPCSRSVITIYNKLTGMARLNRNRIANIAYIAQRFAKYFKKPKSMPNLTWLHVQRTVSNWEVWSNDTASARRWQGEKPHPLSAVRKPSPLTTKAHWKPWKLSRNTPTSTTSRGRNGLERASFPFASRLSPTRFAGVKSVRHTSTINDTHYQTKAGAQPLFARHVLTGDWWSLLFPPCR